MTNPLVSIIVPAFNAAAFLDQSIPSALGQTYSNIEVVIVDDASTDNTLEIAKGYVAKDSRVVVLRHEKNSGLAATRNTGIKASQGEWVAFLDADDVFLPSKTELQLDLWRNDSKANLLYANYWIWDGEKDIGDRYRKRDRMLEGDVSKPLIFGNQFCPSTVMVRRETIDRAGGFNPELRAVEDWDLWLRITEQGLWARGVWEPQIRYRVWAGNMSKNSEKMAYYMIATLESAMARPQAGWRKKMYKRSLAHARANQELALSRKFVGVDAPALRAAIFRAWRFRPGRLKWLLWWLGVAWPPALGGRFFAAPVHRRVLSKW